MAKTPKPAETDAEAERLANEQAEAERLVAERAAAFASAETEAEALRIADEQAEAERLRRVADTSAAAVLADATANPWPAPDDVRAMLAALFEIPEENILAWNIETGTVVTVDGQKLTRPI